MTTETNLATTQPQATRMLQAITEAETHAHGIIAQYSGWATAIMKVVEEKHLYAPIDNKKYLEFEAWQLIGSFDRCFVDTDDVIPVMEDGEKTGYMCRAKLFRDGVRVGGATQICGLDAFPCRGKNGTAKDNAAISAAQTWAGSKALKMRYSSVAVLGGYAAATGDEMRRAQEEQDKSQHWCELHQTNWFKRGKMRHFAHPIRHTKDWCNEPGTTLGNTPYGSEEEVSDEDTTPRVETPLSSGDESSPTPAPALTQAQLQAAIQAEGMTWGAFETQVLEVTWSTFTKRGGTPSIALQRWGHWKTRQPKSVVQ